MLQGPAYIEECVKKLSHNPGVYIMKNEAGQVLYVGKAKSLRKRVVSYTRLDQLSVRILRMVQDVQLLETQETNSEAEAFLLEAHLIKKLKPRYNIVLRDDKTFPYIHLTDHAYPQIVKYRGAKKEAGIYFGPFASGFAVTQTVDVLQKAFLLRNCSDNVFANRSRPCLQYQIKRCSAPCVNYISKEDYAQLIRQAHDFLSGKSTAIKDELVAQMNAKSEARQFEEAAQIRDRIRALNQIQSYQTIHVDGIHDADILTLVRDEGASCILVMFYRGGTFFGQSSYFPRHLAEETDEDILSAFMGQFYQSKPLPELLLLSHKLPEAELLEEAFSTLGSHKVTIHSPERGAKRELVESAMQTARQAVKDLKNKEQHGQDLIAQMSEIFGFPEGIERIEIYDNSHIMGTNAIGAMVVANPLGFDKKQYRKFNIKNPDLVPGDDFGMMREVLERRFKRAQEEETVLPDLVIIDGGLGQFNAAREVLEELGLSEKIALLSIAKGPQRNAGNDVYWIKGAKQAIQLEKNHPVNFYIQRLRDESHRFAIGSHRQKREKSMYHSSLMDIDGVGASRKKALLSHFGSMGDVATASLQDLRKVKGFSDELAQKVYDHFHP